MVGMNPGRFREKVAFYRASTVSDGAGGFTNTGLVLQFWAWAKVDPDKALYSTENERLQLHTAFKAVIRKEAKTPAIDMILRWNQQDYRILEIANADAYGRYIDIRFTRAE